MTKLPELREIPPLPDEIIQAALDGDLVLFIGAGTSILMGLPSWSIFSRQILQQLRTLNLLNHAEIDQIASLNDPKKQLSIAIQLAQSEGLPLDLTKPFQHSQSKCKVYNYINAIGCSYVTTNYDKYLLSKSEENRFYEKDNLRVRHLDTPGSIVHLHGCICKPDTMIISTKDYLNHYDNENVQEFLGHLFDKKTVLFIGYGLEEAEILEHILRRGDVRPGAEVKRFMLQGFFSRQKPLYGNLSSYYQDSFGVDLIGFVRDHEDYAQQVSILENWSRQIKVKPPSLSKDLDFMGEVLGNE